MICENLKLTNFLFLIVLLGSCGNSESDCLDVQPGIYTDHCACPDGEIRFGYVCIEKKDYFIAEVPLGCVKWIAIEVLSWEGNGSTFIHEIGHGGSGKGSGGTLIGTDWHWQPIPCFDRDNKDMISDDLTTHLFMEIIDVPITPETKSFNATIKRVERSDRIIVLDSFEVRFELIEF